MVGFCFGVRVAGGVFCGGGGGCGGSVVAVMG